MKLFKYIRKSRNIYHEYQQAISDLKAITGVDASNREDITELITWFRKEYEKIPNYPGDIFVVDRVKLICLHGYSLEYAIIEAKKDLQNHINGMPSKWKAPTFWIP